MSWVESVTIRYRDIYSGNLPQNEDLLQRQDIVKLKRCIYAAQVSKDNSIGYSSLSLLRQHNYTHTFFLSVCQCVCRSVCLFLFQYFFSVCYFVHHLENIYKSTVPHSASGACIGDRKNVLPACQ